MSRRDGCLGLALFATLLSVYLLTFSGTYHSSDEMSMLVATDSLARRGGLEIDLLRWMGEQQGSFGPDGHLYSRKGIGTTLSALPLYWLALVSERLGNVQMAMLTNAAVTAATGVLVYLLIRRLGYGDGVALGLALLYGLATMAWPYARYLFSEPLAGLGLVLSACGVAGLGGVRTGAGGLNGSDGSPWTSDRRRIHPAPQTEHPLKRVETGWNLLQRVWRFSRRIHSAASPGLDVFLAGAGLAVALLARLNNAVVAPLLGLALLCGLGRRHGKNWRGWIRPLVLFALPVLAALAVSAWYNWLRFGSPWETGYLPQEAFSAPFFRGLYGLTFSPGKGLFWYNPLLFAAMAGVPAFFRRHRPVAFLAAAVVLVHLAFYASWYLWWAGHGWGPRFLVPVLPFAVLPLAPVLEKAARHRPTAVLLSAVAALSLGVQFLGVAVNFNLYLESIHAQLGLYHPATLFNPAYSPLLRQLAYLRPDTLDLAWARGSRLDGRALLAGLVPALASIPALWAARRGQLAIWARIGVPGVLVLGAGCLLVRLAPAGDAAEAARALAAMERPGEALVLTDPLLTESFQDAYDGRLPLWGMPSRSELHDPGNGVWVVGRGEMEPAAARFQVGEVGLALHLPPGQFFDSELLPDQPWIDEPYLEAGLKLVAAQPLPKAVRRGETLPLRLHWRALCCSASGRAPVLASYTVFVQVIDEQGVKAGQIDRLPCNGACPTSSWRPGDLVGEWYQVPVRSDAPPGRYRVIAGMYDLATGENLVWSDSQGQEIGPHLELGSVQVLP